MTVDDAPHLGMAGRVCLSWAISPLSPGLNHTSAMILYGLQHNVLESSFSRLYSGGKVPTANVVARRGRLKEVVYSDKQLYLVFEWIDKDLKKYMDAVPAGLEPNLVKVSNPPSPLVFSTPFPFIVFVNILVNDFVRARIPLRRKRTIQTGPFDSCSNLLPVCACLCCCVMPEHRGDVVRTHTPAVLLVPDAARCGRVPPPGNHAQGLEGVCVCALARVCVYVYVWMSLEYRCACTVEFGCKFLESLRLRICVCAWAHNTPVCALSGVLIPVCVYV